MPNEKRESAADKGERKGIGRRFSTWLTGVTALLATIAAVLTAIGTIDLTPLLNIVTPEQPEMTIVDSEYAVLRDASIWRDTDITEAPIGRLQIGSFIRVRGRMSARGLYAIELSSGKLGYVSSEHLMEADPYRAQMAAEFTNLPQTGSSNTQGKFLFGIRASASWDTDTNIYERPDSQSDITGALTAGRQLGRDVFKNGEVGW